MQKSKKRSNPSSKKEWLRRIAISGTIFIFACILSLTNQQNIFRQNAAPSPDDAVFQSIAFHMSKGEMPYKDIFDHKGPLLYLINFIGFIINKSWGIWLIELAAVFITLLIVYKTARLFADRAWSLATVFLTSTIALSYIWNEATGVETFALPFIAYTIHNFLKFLNERKLSAKEIIATGASLGAIFMLRPNMLAVWAVFCLAVIIEFVTQKQFKELFAYILKFAAGIIIAILPFMLWLLFTGSFAAFIDCYINFNAFYTLNSEASTLTNRLSIMAEPFKNSLILLACLGLPYVFIVNKKLRKTSIYLVATIALTLFTVASSGRNYAHYYTILVPCLAVPIALAFSRLSEKIPHNTLWLIFTLLAFYTILPTWTDQLRGDTSMAAHFRTNLNYEQYSGVIDYIKANSSENDKISAWRNSDSAIYIGSGRLSATRYSYVPEITSVDASREEEFRSQIATEKPKYIVLPKADTTTTPFTGYIESIGYSEVSDFTDQNYAIYAIKQDLAYFETTKVGKVLEDGTLFDPDVFYENDTFYLYVSARGESSIVRYESQDGGHWTNKQTIIALDSESEGTIINRATVLKKDSLYYIYYSTQKDGKSYINVATGSDGVHFEKYKNNPIISPEEVFEGESTMNADVIHDKGIFRMWYATGETYEPNTISYAESKDGFVWKKQHTPIKQKNPDIFYASDRVGGPEILKLDGKYYLFYIGYSDIDTGYIMLSSSTDGESNFKDYEYPLVASSAAGFDKSSVYKPTVHYDEESDRLYLWYNGRNQSLETIGFVKIENFKKTAEKLGL